MSTSECTFHGEQESYQCGYCNGTKQKSRCTHGATFSTLTTEDYQRLMFRGWRRSGAYCYKPVMREICCPQYTIRCDVAQYRPSRSHRRLLKRMDAFLRTGARPSKAAAAAAAAAAGGTTSQANNSNAGESQKKTQAQQQKSQQQKQKKQQQQAASVESVDGSGDGDIAAGAGRMRIGKARQKRWARRLARLRAKADEASDGDGLEAVMAAYRARRAARAAARAPKTLEQLLESEGQQREQQQQKASPPKHRLRVVLLPSARQEFDSASELPLYRRYQTTVHGDSPDECDLMQFRRFLCQSPLVYAKRGDHWLGSFHQQYWLEPENRLIMVGVVDVLPDCTSSVYVFYDPDYAWLNLGTYAALREIAHTRRLGLPHYCMGYYIHDCGKMRYKGAFAGSQLLCPETYTWHSLSTVCAPMLDVKAYCRFAPRRSNEQEAEAASAASAATDTASPPPPPDDLQVAIGRRNDDFVPFRRLRPRFAGQPHVLAMVDELAATFAELVGPECARTIRVRFV